MNHPTVFVPESVICDNYEVNQQAIEMYGSELAGDCMNCIHCRGSWEEHQKLTRHATVFVPEVNADIDIDVVELVKAFNHIPGVQSFSSCQGDDEQPAMVSFYSTGNRQDWRELGRVAYDVIQPLFGLAPNEDVRALIQLAKSWDGYLAHFQFNHEDITGVLERIRSLTDAIQ